MTAIRTYKHFIAAILVALYAFIATPVQLWHHHNNSGTVSNSIAGSEKAKHDTVSNSSDSQSEIHCTVCSHKYSTYEDDALLPFESSIVLTGAKNGYYSLPVIGAPSFPLPNKGPPSLS